MRGNEGIKLSYVEQLRKKIGHDEYIGVGAGVFIYKDRNVLLQKRKDNGCWSMHSGGLEIGETVEEAAKRELLEEMGLPIEIDKFFMQSVYEYEFGSFAINAFWAHSKTDKIPLLSAHEQYKWVLPQEMSNYKYPPADAPIVEQLIKFYNQK